MIHSISSDAPRSARRLLQLACLGVALAMPLALAPAALAQDGQEQGQQDAGAQQDDQAQTGAAQLEGQQEAPPPQTQQAGPPQELVRLADDFYHAARMGQYTAAQALGEQILGGNYHPQDVLDAFNEVHSRREHPRGAADLDNLLLTWQRTEQIAGVATEITNLINQGRIDRAIDRDFVAQQLERLSQGSTAYRNALAQLRHSGEYAVPVMIDYLLNREKTQHHADIRRAMRDLGADMLNPLWAATQMEDQQVLASLMVVMGDLGYDASIPYLLEQVESTQNDQVRRAAQQALQRLGYSGGSSAAREFYRLSERFYYEQTPVVPNRRLGTATIWSWNPGAGLIRTDVPPPIFNEVMAMRAAGKSLALGGQDEALSLWLASNYRREGELREGEQDLTQPEGSPSAHYYGAQAGSRYLQMVLARAQTDRQRLARGNRYNTADVSLRAIKSLQEIAGRGNVGAGETPLTTAMNFPDRRVRIEAAFALAQVLPREPIAGQEQVIPLLADAMSQTGQPTVLVLSPEQETLNQTVEQLRGQNYRAQGTTSVVDTITQAQALPSVDVILIDQRLGDGAVNDLLANAQSNPKLSGAAKLVLVSTEASRYEQMKLENPTLETTTARSGEELVQAVESARLNVGGLPLDPDQATELALRSGRLLQLIGTSNSVFRIENGESFLLAALNDERPEVKMLAGEVVALLDSQRSQQALLEAAMASEQSPEVRISLLNSLAASAKLYGNRLQSGEVDNLLAAAADRTDLDVQAAAAEAAGALNLPADQARRLIIEQTAGTERTASSGGASDSTASGN